MDSRRNVCYNWLTLQILYKEVLPMKRILALLLALVLAVPLVPIRAEAKTGGKLVALTSTTAPAASIRPSFWTD